MDLTLIQEYLGDFGRYQIFVFSLICIVFLCCGIHMLSNAFLLAVPKHRCYVPNCDNNSTRYAEDFVHFAIPNVTGGLESSCARFGLIKGENYCGPHAFNTNISVPCTRYLYDHSEYEETAISEFDMVCKDSWSGAASSSIFMFGVLCGSVTFGLIADRFGRKNVMMGSVVGLLVSSVGTAFAPSFGLFSFLHFLTAAFVNGLFQTGYILGVEFVGTSKRVFVGNVLQIVFAIGEVVLGVVAYYVRNWRYLQLSISTPAVVLLIYYWLLPESVRWLNSKGRHNEAKKTILKAARWNKVTIPEHLLRASEYSNEDSELDHQKKSVKPWSLFKTPRLRKWSFNIFFNWIVNAMVYYGLSLSAGNLSGDAYANFVILSAVEIPAIILATWALYYCGRRSVLCSVMVFGGVSCAATILVPQAHAWISTALAVTGKSAIAASFAIIYIYSAEIYPTVLRSTGIGLSSMFARLGGILAPVIMELRSLFPPLPIIIFGAAAIASGLLALALPETYNRQLPETIEDAENFGSSTGLINASEHEEDSSPLPASS